MSVVVLGGLDRLKQSYQQKGKDLGFDIRVFSQRVPKLGKRMHRVGGIVIFTGTIAHPMVEQVVRAARLNNIQIKRTHSSSVSAFKRCLSQFHR